MPIVIAFPHSTMMPSVQVSPIRIEAVGSTTPRTVQNENQKHTSTSPSAIGVKRSRSWRMSSRPAWVMWAAPV